MKQIMQLMDHYCSSGNFQESVLSRKFGGGGGGGEEIQLGSVPVRFFFNSTKMRCIKFNFF